MNLYESTIILIDSAKQMPETPHLKRAIKRMEKRLEILQARREKYLAMRRRKLETCNS